MNKTFEPIQYHNGSITIVNQLQLPAILEYETYSDYLDILDAINAMKIRGASLVGIASAYGLLLALKDKRFIDEEEFLHFYKKMKSIFITTRESMRSIAYIYSIFDAIIQEELPFEEKIKKIEVEAVLFHKNEALASKKIVQLAYDKLFSSKNKYSIITIGNYGKLSTDGVGNTTGIFKTILKNEKKLEIFIDETRPCYQGSRLTAWELKNCGIPYTIITSPQASNLMKIHSIDCVLLGAEHMALNGDTVAKIGSLNLAILANYFKIPVFIVTSTSIISARAKTGSQIKLDTYKSSETLLFNELTPYPKAAKTLSFSFDIIPSSLITAIITENGILDPQVLRQTIK